MPARKTPAKSSQSELSPRVRHDRWANYLTGIGNALRDKTLETVCEVENITEDDAENIWRADDIGAKIVCVPVKEMFRQGYLLNIGGVVENKEEIERAVLSRMADLQVNKSLKLALEYRRAYGGGAVLLGADDGQKDLSKPLRIESIKALSFLTVMRPRELQPYSWYEDAGIPKYGTPEVFSVVPEMGVGAKSKLMNGQKIHESRLVIFRGPVVSRRVLRENNGWGDSIFVRILTVLSQFHQVWGGSANLLADFSQAVLKIKGLAELLSGNKRDKVTDRAIGIDMSRSIARTVILDSTEDWTRQVTPMAGYPDMIDRWMLRISAAADIPASKLFRQAPAGLNATGDSDVRFFYDDIGTSQDEELRPGLEQVIRCIMLSKQGPTAGVEPTTWGVEFNSLWQVTDKENAEAHEKQATADEKMIVNGVATPEEIAMSRFGGEKYSYNTKLDHKTRQAYQTALTRATDPANDKPREPQSGLLTPTDVATIITVNQALAWLGFPVKALPGGTPDPDGELTVAQYQAKNTSTIAAAASAVAGQTAPTPATPPLDHSDSMGVFLRAEIARRTGTQHA